MATALPDAITISFFNRMTDTEVKKVTLGERNIWTPYGKVREVLKADGSQVSYRYDGAGNRVAKIIHRNDSTLTTHYVRDASGHELAIYQDSLLAEQPIYGSSRLGMYQGGRKTGERTLGRKNYELSNHLGNVLAVITDNINMDNDSVWATTVSLNDYYPFGLGMEGRSMRSSKYRFGFNGKEKDSNGEFGAQTAYDYGFRIYNPAIGKFLSVDPLTAQYPGWSPYPFAMGRPIDGVDLDGLEYLDADEAKVEFKYGGLQLKVENFLWINRRMWSVANADPKNWKTNEIGISRRVANLELIRPTRESELASIDNTYSPYADPNYDPTQHRTSGRLTQQSGYTEVDQRFKNGSSSHTLSGASNMTGPTAKSMLVLDVLNMAAEQYMKLAYAYDKNIIDNQTDIARKAVNDVGKALNKGWVPDKYQTTEGLTNILNVVLTGTNNTDDEEIYNIGMKIYNYISRPFDEVNSKTPDGADNTRVNRTYMVPKTINDEN